MTYPERKEKEKHLLYLIEQERLFNLENVAKDYNCSVRTVKRMLENLRNEGENIAYCRKNNKYILEK